MRRRTRVAIGLVVAVAGLWGLTGAALAADSPVTISGFAFGPSSVTVTAGDTVTWTNQDGVAHTATGGDGSFDTGNIPGGATATVTFSTAGTFAYACRIHPTMTGTVVVEAASGGGGEAGGGGTTTPPATDTLPSDAATVHESGTTVVAALLAILGVAMILGTIVFDRRAAATTAPATTVPATTASATGAPAEQE
jgi:plastocyanin